MAKKTLWAFPKGDEPGMQLVDWFAGMALQGLLAASPTQVEADDAEDLVQRAYILADEMILESDKPDSH